MVPAPFVPVLVVPVLVDVAVVEAAPPVAVAVVAVLAVPPAVVAVAPEVPPAPPVVVVVPPTVPLVVPVPVVPVLVVVSLAPLVAGGSSGSEEHAKPCTQQRNESDPRSASRFMLTTFTDSQMMIKREPVVILRANGRVRLLRSLWTESSRFVSPQHLVSTVQRSPLGCRALAFLTRPDHWVDGCRYGQGGCRRVSKLVGPLQRLEQGGVVRTLLR